MTDKSVTEQLAPRLRSLPESSPRDQLGALLSSPLVAPVAERHSEGRDHPADFAESIGERDTEPNIDAEMLRNVLREGLK